MARMSTPAFTGYSPDQMQTMAHRYGYTDVNIADFGTFLEENPSRAKEYFDQQNLDMFGEEKMEQFKAGGLLAFQQGGTVPVPYIATETAARYQDPSLPQGGQVAPSFVPFQQEQLMGEQTGQLLAPAQQATAQQAALVQQAVPSAVQAEQITDVEKATPAIEALTVQAAQMQAPSQLVAAAEDYDTNVSNLQAAQLGQAVQIESPAVRALQTGETIATAVGQAAQAAAFTESAAQAATATPTPDATVQGQLAGLMLQFEQSEDTPIWARGAVRLAQQEMAKRGLGASSMAGQAMVEAAMQSAVSIAQIDANVVAAFEKQNLSNRQQMATVRAEHRARFMGQEFDQEFKTRVQNAARISDIADRNFTAEQQIALENSRLAQSVALNNLSNQQGLVIAEATALASLETASLNNRQKAAVENAKNFLQLDMANLSNTQQASKIQYERITQSLLTDAAEQNINNKINATEANQMTKFYSDLIANVGKANADATNAMNRFNAGEANAINRFNADMANNREQFNAKNQLAIEQSNALWRREISTVNTAAANRSNEINAKNSLNISDQAYNNLWQEYRDVMEFAFEASESQMDRINNLEVSVLKADASYNASKYQADKAQGNMWGEIIGKIAGVWAQANF